MCTNPYICLKSSARWGLKAALSARAQAPIPIVELDTEMP